MFEVGKKYRLKGQNRPHDVKECIWVEGDRAILRTHERAWLAGNAYETSKGNFSGYEEVKEPRTIKGWVNIYQTAGGNLSFGNIWDSEEKASEYSTGYIVVDTIPIEYVEKI